jgi:hypothetical protein
MIVTFVPPEANPELGVTVEDSSIICPAFPPQLMMEPPSKDVTTTAAEQRNQNEFDSLANLGISSQHGTSHRGN